MSSSIKNPRKVRSQNIWVWSEHLGLPGTRRPWASDSHNILGRFIWSPLKSLYLQPHVHYCTNTRDATGLPKPHHSLPACNPQREREGEESCFLENVWSVGGFPVGRKINTISRRLVFYLYIHTSVLGGCVCVCVFTRCYMLVCVPLCVWGSAPVCRVIYWKALQWYQNSFALNACSECLLLPVCFMDHDHTLFVSHFYISKDYFLWLLVFIRVESVRKKKKKARKGGKIRNVSPCFFGELMLK